ncbi:MAG: hypothetical protein RQ866_02460 [Bacteroidales bacterium]|nr:hypothetical protein [Bacteroidales bacterium]
MRIIPLLILLAFLFTACDKGKVYQKRYKMDKNSWKRVNSELLFEVDIQDTAALYDIDLEIRHADFYPYEYIDIGFNIYYPGDEEHLTAPRIFLRDKDGAFKGKGSGEIWDFTYPIRREMSFPERGVYTIEVCNYTGSNFVLPGIMEIGLIVRKTKR